MEESGVNKAKLAVAVAEGLFSGACHAQGWERGPGPRSPLLLPPLPVPFISHSSPSSCHQNRSARVPEQRHLYIAGNAPSAGLSHPLSVALQTLRSPQSLRSALSISGRNSNLAPAFSPQTPRACNLEGGRRSCFRTQNWPISKKLATSHPSSRFSVRTSLGPSLISRQHLAQARPWELPGSPPLDKLHLHRQHAWCFPSYPALTCGLGLWGFPQSLTAGNCAHPF